MSLGATGCRLVAAIAVVAGASAIAAAQAKPSATALEVAAYRAIGARHPDTAVRNGDQLAERLLGPAERAILVAGGARGVHVRTRHIDEVLGDSLAAGIDQVVLLGAGLDSLRPQRTASWRMKLKKASIAET